MDVLELIRPPAFTCFSVGCKTGRPQSPSTFQKYGHRYRAEVQYRFNRRFDLSSILKNVLITALWTPPRPERFDSLGRLNILANQVAV
jgi:hypothetical protein